MAATLVLLPPLLLLLGELGGPSEPDLPPVGDHAALELYTRQAAAGRQLLGPYSRFGFHHPGPAFFYLAVPLYLVTGESFRGLVLTAVFINVLSIVVILRLAGRGGAGALLGAALALALIIAARGPAWLFSAWNPTVVVMPVGVALFALAAFSAGGDWALPVAGVAASFAAQTHVGCAAGLLAITVAALSTLLPPVRRAWGLPHRTGGRRLGASMTVALALLGLMWSPTIAEQLAPGGGNVSHILGFARHSGGDHPLGDAWSAVAGQAAGYLVGGDDGRPLPTALALAMALVGAWLVARRKQALVAALAPLTAVIALAALASASRVTGSILGYLMRWAAMIGVAALAAGGGALGLLSARTSANMRRVAGGLALLALGAVSATTLRQAWRALEESPEPAVASEVAGRLAAQVAPALARAGVSHPLIEVGPATDREVVLGVLLALDKRGVKWSVRPFGPFRLGGRWGVTGMEDGTVVIGHEGEAVGTLLAREAGMFVYLRRPPPS